MTIPVTHGNTVVIHNPTPPTDEGGPDRGETGRASDARAREATPEVAVTHGHHKLVGFLRRKRAEAAHSWAYINRPLSLRATWRLSAVDPGRVPPEGHWWLLLGWHISNWTDRPLWFALMLVAPSGLQGPLRWAATRPTRRLGTYLLAVVLLIVLVVAKVS